MVKNKYHFIAIGGVGMSGLAKYLLQQGYEVSGSDISESKYTKELQSLGGRIYLGHSEDNVPNDAIVVVSSAIKDDNPELKLAKKLNLKIFHRSDLLAHIANNNKFFIGFSGTHGKTTTSGMCSYLLTKSGLNPSFVVGGIIPELNTNAEYNKNGQHFIAELDESDGTIVKYRPNIIVVNNLESDHLDFYKNGLSDILHTFNDLFLSKLTNSKIIVNNDNEGVRQLPNIDNYTTYGLNNADYIAKNINYNIGSTEFEIHYKENLLGEVTISLPGKHNVYNTLAVVSAIHQSGIENINDIIKYLPQFSGMGRRFQKVADINGASIYDDYAHHPTEIYSTLSALHSFTDKKIIAVFQPHRYTRLKSLWNEFKEVFLNNATISQNDKLVITDVYSASEKEIDGINGEKFANEINNSKYISGNISNVAEKLYPLLDNNTIVIGLGAGSITNLGKELLKIQEKENYGA